MSNRIVKCSDEAATQSSASCFAAALESYWLVDSSHILISLDGPLGAGKTTFTQGVLRALGYSGRVKSPTYTLVEPYAVGARHIYHFDLYRLSDPEELEYMGARDYFSDDNVCLVEWASRGAGVLPQADIIVDIQPGVELSERELVLSAQSVAGETVLAFMHF